MRSLIIVLIMVATSLSAVACSHSMPVEPSWRGCDDLPQPVAVPATPPNSVSMNWETITVQVEFFGHHGTIRINGEDIPIYIRGDQMTVRIRIDYSGDRPLDEYPNSYASLVVWHTNPYYNQMIPTSRWERDPLLIPVGEEVEIVQSWNIPTNLYPNGQVMQMDIHPYYNRQIGGKVFRCPIGVWRSYWFFG